MPVHALPIRSQLKVNGVHKTDFTSARYALHPTFAQIGNCIVEKDVGAKTRPLHYAIPVMTLQNPRKLYHIIEK